MRGSVGWAPPSDPDLVNASEPDPQDLPQPRVSLFDLAGRVYKNKPAPDNLKVPPYTYLSDTRILIGEDKKGA